MWNEKYVSLKSSRASVRRRSLWLIYDAAPFPCLTTLPLLLHNRCRQQKRRGRRVAFRGKLSRRCKRLTKKLMRVYRTCIAIKLSTREGRREWGGKGKGRYRWFTQLAPELIRPTCLDTAFLLWANRHLDNKREPTFILLSGQRGSRRGLRKHADVNCPSWFSALEGGSRSPTPWDETPTNRRVNQDTATRSRSVSDPHDICTSHRFLVCTRNRWMR